MASDVPPPQMNWLEQQFANSNIVLLCIFGFCCNLLAAIIAAVVYFTAKNPTAKQNALIVMIVGFVVWLLYCGGGGLMNLRH
jgi:hypothetical protein